MKSKILIVISSILVLVIMMACSLTSTALPTQQDSEIVVTDHPGSLDPELFVAETGGPAGFTATLSSSDVVSFAWEIVSDAVGYEVQIVYDGLKPLTIAFLPADATSFVHFLSPESSLLTYRLQTITANGPAGASSLQISTLAHDPNPLTVQAVFSETGVASAVIGPEGGSLETTDESGVNYSLVIPPQALDTDLEIKMTPVSTINGWPLDGDFLGAVRLEPEGWLLNEIATLTIRIPDPVSLSLVAFAINSSGNEFHLTPSYSDAASLTSLGTEGTHLAKLTQQTDTIYVEVQIIELEPTGLGETSTSIAGKIATENSPTSNKDAADQKSAVANLMDDELAPLQTFDQLGTMATEKLLSQIINSKDCYDFKRAGGSFQAWENKVTQSNGDHFSYYDVDRKAILDALAKKAVETIEKASEECTQAEKGVVPASIPCAEKLTRDIQSASNPFYAELQNTMKKTAGLLDRLTAANDASKNCPHSFKVNEAASLGYQWTSGCIPSLDRPFQVGFIGLNLEGFYRLYPSEPFDGRVNGQLIQSLPGGYTSTNLYEGTYKIEVTKADNQGDPQEMDAVLTIETTTTQCIEGNCVTSITDGELLIPLLVNKSRCTVP